MYALPTLDPSEVLIYLRKSRSDDPAMTVEEVLAKHEHMLDEWCMSRLGGTVPEANRFREVVSGETITDRPEVQTLLRLVESPRYKAILVVEPQRLSRGDLEDAGRIIKLLRYSETLVLTLSYNYDLRDEMDRENFGRELKRGNEFLEYQKRIMLRGRIASVEAGNYIGSKPPFGYDRVSRKDGRKTLWTLAINQEQAEVVKEIFRLYTDGLGATRICDRLNASGAVSATGAAWIPTMVYTILRNPHYIGAVRWNERKTVRTIVDGEVVVSRPRANDAMLFPGRHPALIDEATFRAVQERLGKAPRTKSGHELVNPFSGLLYCACGQRMTYRPYKAHGVDRCRPRILCYDQRHCGTPSAAFDEIFAVIADALKQSLDDIEVQIRSGKSGRQRQTGTKHLEDRLAKLEAKEIRQWDAYSSGDMPEHVFRQLNAELTAEKERLRQALDAAKAERPGPVTKDFAARLHKAIDSLGNPKISAKAKNELLRACVDKIVYSRPNGEIKVSVLLLR